jgi:uncharacterized protein YbbK (DUF523 family)
VIERTAIVSACLLGVPCRHDGRDKAHAQTIALLEARGLSVLPICPEVAGGLPIPRAAAFVDSVHHRVIDANDRDVTAQFEAGAQAALDLALERGATLAILKQNSPSCGSHTIGTRSGRASGQGVTAAKLSQAGLEVFGEDQPW